MASPKKLLIHPPIDADRLEKVRAAAEGCVVVNAQSAEEARREARDADGFFGKLTPELLAAASQLSWVQSPTASLEHFLFPELAAHPSQLTNMRGLFSDVIADHVFGYILCFARNLHIYLRRQSQRRWAPCGGESARSSFSAGPGEVTPMDRAHRHLSDETIGVFGLGHIGEETARRAQAFGMRVLAFDPHRESPPPGVEMLADVGRLLAESDYLVIAAPHTPETEGRFGRAEFQQMKPTGVLINIGRGVIVRLQDLTEALQAGEIFGAALDVFETEPLPADHPLWEMENVLITPHVAACSTRVPERHLQTLLENVRRFAAGEPLRNVVRKDLWF